MKFCERSVGTVVCLFCAEKIRTCVVCVDIYHVHSLRVYGVGDDSSLWRQILNHLMQGSPLHLLPLEVRQWVWNEVEQHATLPELLDEKLFTFGGCCICNCKANKNMYHLFTKYYYSYYSVYHSNIYRRFCLHNVTLYHIYCHSYCMIINYNYIGKYNTRFSH